MASLHEFYYTALTDQRFLYWMQWDLEGTVALLVLCLNDFCSLLLNI